MESIFGNSNIFYLSDPQPTWLYDVVFQNENSNVVTNYFNTQISTGGLVPTSVTLPSHHTETVTLKYYGTEKTFPTLRTYGGDCTMTFDIRANDYDNAGIYAITQVLALTEDRIDTGEYGSTKYLKDYVGVDRPKLALHSEIEKPDFRNGRYNLERRDEVIDFPNRCFNKVIVKLKDKRGNVYKDGQVAPIWHSIYEYYNCVITEFSFDKELNYANEDKLTCKLTFHYDIWHKVIDSTTDSVATILENNKVAENKGDELRKAKEESYESRRQSHFGNLNGLMTDEYLSERRSAIEKADNELTQQSVNRAKQEAAELQKENADRLTNYYNDLRSSINERAAEAKIYDDERVANAAKRNTMTTDEKITRMDAITETKWSTMNYSNYKNNQPLNNMTNYGKSMKSR